MANNCDHYMGIVIANAFGVPEQMFMNGDKPLLQRILNYPVLLKPRKQHDRPHFSRLFGVIYKAEDGRAYPEEFAHALRYLHLVDKDSFLKILRKYDTFTAMYSAAQQTREPVPVAEFFGWLGVEAWLEHHMREHGWPENEYRNAVHSEFEGAKKYITEQRKTLAEKERELAPYQRQLALGLEVPIEAELNAIELGDITDDLDDTFGHLTGYSAAHDWFSSTLPDARKGIFSAPTKEIYQKYVRPKRIALEQELGIRQH